MMRQSHPTNDSFTLSRREFIGATAAATGVALFTSPLRAIEISAELPTYRFQVQRDWDLLSLGFSFVNFEKRGRELRAIGAGQSLVIVRFPPQNLAEAIFDEEPPHALFEYAPLPLPKNPTHENSPIPPIRSCLSGPSWLVFVAPDGMRVPLVPSQRSSNASTSVVDDWLRMMSDWKIRVPRNAVRPSQPSMPGLDESCLEIPFRLFLAPNSDDARWLTSSEKMWGVDAEQGSIRELWHASLLSRVPIVPASLPEGYGNLPPEFRPPTRVVVQARAVYSPDYQPHGEPPKDEYYPGRMQLSLHTKTRHLLVKQMAEGNGWIDAEHLILSSLGCDANLSYTNQKSVAEILEAQLNNADGANDTQLAIWKHRIVVGRDVYFVEAFLGFLFPFVNPALAVELTRRKFVAHEVPDSADISSPGAFLLKEYFVLLLDPLQRFTDSGSPIGRGMPIKKTVFKELRSPLLTNFNDPDNFNIKFDCIKNTLPDGVTEKCVKNQLYFIPRRLEDKHKGRIGDNSGADGVRWSLEFEDESGQISRTTDACMLFAQNVVKGRRIWEALQPRFRRWSMPAQSVAFAPQHAELSVIAEKPLTHQGQAVQAGQTLGIHELEPREKQAARVLAEVLRRSQKTTNWEGLRKYVAKVKGNVEEFVANAEELDGEVTDEERELLKQFRPETLAALFGNGKIAAAFQSLPKDFRDEAYKELLRQFTRAQQVTSTLEAHMLEFGCTRVDQLFDNAPGELQRKAQSAKDLSEFIGALSDVIKEDDKKGILKGEAQKLRARIEGELKSRVESLGNDWGIQKPELLAYVGEMADAANNAKQLANQYFHAELANADVAIPALKAFANGSPIRSIKPLDDYLSKGMGTLGQGLSRVQNGAFAQLTEIVDQGTAMADKVKSGVAQPAALIAGLSRDLGALSGSGPDTIKKLANQYAASQDQMPVLDDLKKAIPDSKLFGVLPLRELVGILAEQALDRNQMPTISQLTLPDHFESTWQWTTKLTAKDFGFISLIVEKPKKPAEPTSLHIASVTRIETPKSKAEASSPHGLVTVNGFLGRWDERGAKGDESSSDPEADVSFAIDVLGLVKVNFYYIKFSSRAALGQTPKTDFDPKMGEIEFQGPLKFVKDLQDLLAGLLGDTFELMLTPEFVQAGFALPLPPITTGVFTMCNIAVGASIRLSFTNQPLRFNFNFCTERRRAALAVLCFGGTAYLQVALMSDGSKELTGALDFGGLLAFDVGVAWGDVHVLAGFYFRITNSQTDLAGYLRAGGNLYVLGLIHASVEFVLMGRYTSEKTASGTDHLIYGTCTISVSIDLFLVSFDVSITMEKKFLGSHEENSDSHASTNRNRLSLVSYQEQMPTPAYDPVRAYFDRKPRTASGINRRGRFEYSDRTPAAKSQSVSRWDRAYWSQFAF